MANSKITSLTNYSSPDGTTDVIPIGQRKVELTCKMCNLVYEKHISRKSVYCSQDCYILWKHKNPKGIKKECVTCKREFIVSKIISDVRINCSKACNAIWQSKVRKGIDILGKNRSALSGKDSPNWIGGRPNCKRCDKMLGNYHPVTGICKECLSKNSIGRYGGRAKGWAIAIKKRDNFTCQHCGTNGGPLESDHIKPWSLYPELRFDLDNGRTLCKPCHIKTDTYAGKALRGAVYV